MRHVALIVSCLMCTAAGAADPDTKVSVAAKSKTQAGVAAELKPTQGNAVTGMLRANGENLGVRITGTVQGLEAGAEHAFHIHEKGDCSAPDAKSAGEHFNPTSQQHGNPSGADAKHHLGDMKNLKADAKGVAKVDFFIDGATLQAGQPTDVVGKAIIVHQSADDYTSQPAGNAGDRVACGVLK